VKAEQDLHE
jgi:hypothetical protein